MIIYLVLFIFGLVVGSFLSVVVYRETRTSNPKINNQKSKIKKNNLEKYLPAWVIGRSFCDNCKKQIKWFDNIPLLSYVLLKGKCRYCKKKITISYPMIELFTAIEFVWIYWVLSQFSFFRQMEGILSFGVLLYWIFIFTLSFTLAVIDFKKQILPDSLVFTGIVVSVLRLVITGRWQFLISGLVLFGLFWLLYQVTLWIYSREGIGFGDVKLAFFIGVTLGWWQWVLIATMIAFLTGALFGIILIIMQKKSMKSSLAFGPFLLFGMLVAKLFADQIWQLLLGV
jgi:leader peptidase (prepilin peptidase) / N-methyltransferase